MPKTFISLVLLGLALVLGVIFLWPRYQEMNNLQIQIANQEQEIQNRDKYYQKLSLLSQKIDEKKEEIAKIDSALPPYFSAPSFLKFLQKVAPENGLILTSVGSFSVKPSSGKPDIKEIQVSLGLSGSYSSLKNFLKTLEKSARLIEVDSISFSASETEEGEISEIFNFQLGIKTYSY